jgi:hypothetical protein
MTDRKLKPFFCFYGGKWRAAPRYPAPTHATIIEPFAGAAGYSTRHPDRAVVLIEKDPVIAALWRYLIRVSPGEIARIPLLAHDQNVDDLGAVAPEARSLVGFWLNKGASAPCLRPSKWMRGGTRANSFWGVAIRERIASQVTQIRHWRVVEGSYTQIANPARVATWFVDPPYQRQGYAYKYSSKAIDFAHLGEWCRLLRGQVMVCEQEGADWLPFERFATIQANPSKNGKGKSNEVLWQGHSKPNGRTIIGGE